MSKLDDLIKELCPDGVEYHTLGEIGKFYNGLTGKKKEDFTDGNAIFISYMNVYSNSMINIDVDDRVRISEKEKQNTVQYGDIIFTGSSETPDECGMSSVLVKHTEQKLYLNSFCFGYRFNDVSMFLPDFTKHLFRSDKLRYQIIKAANGVTRFNVSKKKMATVRVPVPPIEIQRKIVHILDNFTELTAELTARKQQYEHYRNSLLSFEDEQSGDNIPQVELRSVVKKHCTGATPKKGNAAYYESGNIPWIRTQDVKFNEIYEVDSFITEEAVKRTAVKWIPENCVIVAISGASAGRCAVNKIRATTNQHCLNMEIDEEKALYQYVYYCVSARYDELVAKKQGARGDLNSTLILETKIPMPPIKTQKQIVDKIDAFNALLNDLASGLPAEIAARQQQYEYYRDKLLTFTEK